MNDPVTDASADTPSGGAPDHLEGLSAERRAAVEAGTMSVDEARAAEGLPPIEEEPKRMTLEELQAQAIEGETPQETANRLAGLPPPASEAPEAPQDAPESPADDGVSRRTPTNPPGTAPTARPSRDS